jgi:hypothetical protein
VRRGRGERVSTRRERGGDRVGAVGIKVEGEWGRRFIVGGGPVGDQLVLADSRGGGWIVGQWWSGEEPCREPSILALGKD